MTPEARTSHRLRGASRPGLSEARSWIGKRATAALGSGVGRIEDIWVDSETGEPAWLLIREGRFAGGTHKLVPFAGATEGGGPIWLPFEREMIRSAPSISTDQALTAELAERLDVHYGIGRNRPKLRRPTRRRRTV
jgi:hypothetical protein